MSQFLWAVEHCGCIYESGFDLESLHATKRGAAKAMNALKAKLHEDYVSNCADHKGELYLTSARREPHFYGMEALRYRKVEVRA